MLRAVGFGVLAITEISCLRLWRRTGLLEMMVITSDLEDSAGKKQGQDAAERFSVIIATNMLVVDDTEVVK